MKLFFQIVCGPLCSSNPLTTVEWYLVFTSLCIVLSQLPNLNSIAGLSLVGAVTAITYSTMVWVLSVSQQRPPTISYEPLPMPSFAASVFSIMNALGIVAFAFRGHNLVLEIQVCTLESWKDINSFFFFTLGTISKIIISWRCVPRSSNGVYLAFFRQQCHQHLSTQLMCQCGEELKLPISLLQCVFSLLQLEVFGRMETL